MVGKIAVAINWKGEEKNPYLRADSLVELLEWHDADFVRCAFVTILGRQPDAAGEGHYVGRLRAGHSRLQILSELRKSAEAAQHDPGIAGLDGALRLAALQRMPFLGAIFRLFSKYPDGNARSDRSHRAMLNAAAANQAAVHSLATQMQSFEWKLHGHAVHTPHLASAGAQRLGLYASAGLPPFGSDLPTELEHLATNNPLARHFATRVA